MSLLTIIQTAANLLSLPAPTVVVGSTDVQVLQLYSLANEEVRELTRDFDWQALRAQKTFLTVADEDQPDAVPADWMRFLSDSFWNRTTRLQLIGPITPQLWQAILAQPQLNRVFLTWIRRGNVFKITPTPPADQEIAYEYISKNCVESDGGALQPQFEADTDEALLDEYLITLGVRWRFRKSKNLDYAEDFRTYEREKQVQQSADVGGGALNQTGYAVYNDLSFPNVPVGSWPTN